MTGHPESGRLDRLDAEPREARLELLAHLRACASCRARLAAEDPSRVFALLVLAPLPEPKLEGLSARVRAELDRAEPPGRGWRAAASIAASLLLAAALGGWLVKPAPPAATPPIAELPAGPPPVALATSVELLAPAAAEVVRMKVGETQLTMIFDERLDL